MEWVVAKGIASFAGDHSQSSSDEWFSFGSTMAASFVADILRAVDSDNQAKLKNAGRRESADLNHISVG